MRLRAVRPFRRAGEHVEPGTLLDVMDAREAHVLVHVYHDCVVVDEGEAAPVVITHADPVVQSRDPVSAKPPRRRGS